MPTKMMRSDGLRISTAKASFSSKALELAREGIIPSGAYNNMGYIQDQIQIANTVPLEVSDVLADPQTAGGLLIALPEHKAPELLSQLDYLDEEARCASF